MPRRSDGESSGDGSPNATASNCGDKDLEGVEKMCAVCGDRATGYHFHVMTCEGCKGFFRRTVIKGIQFTCSFSRSCTITKAKRRQCQACRYQKCLDVGMRKDMVMSEEDLSLRRTLRQQKRHQGQSPTVACKQSEGSSLTAEQEQLIEILTEAHKKHFDSSFAQFAHYQPPVRLFIHSPRSQSPRDPTFPPVCPLSPQESYSEEVLPDVFSTLPLLADMTTFMIQEVVQFAKAIPSFRSLPLDDQISLLKGATLQIGEIQFNTLFNEETNAWQCGQHCLTIQDIVLAGFQQIYLEPMLKFHISLKKLRLHEAEYVLLQALVLFSPDHVNVTQRDEIDHIQEKIALTLKNYIDQRHPLPGGRFLYAKLLSLLTELRTLTAVNRRQMLHHQDLTTMTPLLTEIIS